MPTSISDCLARLTNLTKLSLICKNDDSAVFKALSKLTSLQELSLSSLPFESLLIPEAELLTNLTNLRSLEIRRSSFAFFLPLVLHLEQLNSIDPTILEIQELLPKSSLHLGTYQEGKPSNTSSLITSAFVSTDKPKDSRTLEEILSAEQVKETLGLFPLFQQLETLELCYAPSEEDKKLLSIFFPSLEVKLGGFGGILESYKGSEWASVARAVDDTLRGLACDLEEYYEEEILSDEDL